LAIDATRKIGPEKRHEWGEPLVRSEEQEKHIDLKLKELGLSDAGTQEPDPTLFGYVLENLLYKSK